MRIYFDNCCYNRPFDDQSSLTIRFETEAILAIQEKIELNQLSLGWSYVLDYENSANPFIERQTDIWKWKALADSFTGETPEILAKMDDFLLLGLKPLDALHVACAIVLKCEYFLTVDKGILRKSDAISQVLIINLVDLMMKWETKP